jgi:uncharacterized protein (DUF2141 family)
MAKLYLIILSLSMLFAPKEKLHIIVKDIQTGKGNINVAIYDNKNNFFKIPFAVDTTPASADSLEFSFDIPAGEYAVAVYQDINKNGILDKGIFSIPKEPYGLSNNYRPFLSAPTYEDCKFKLDGNKTLRIKLK